MGAREVRKGLLELAVRCLVGPSGVGRWEEEMEFQGGRDVNTALEGAMNITCDDGV